MTTALVRWLDATPPEADTDQSTLQGDKAWAHVRASLAHAAKKIAGKKIRENQNA